MKLKILSKIFNFLFYLTGLKTCFYISILYLLPFTLYPLPSYATITQTINYQGFLVSKTNNLPLDSPQDIKFVIYNVPSGGSPLWIESRCNVPVSKGRYDVEIGSTTSGGIPSSIFENNQQLWLEVQVAPDGDCTGPYEAMQPRIKLQASPYSFKSLYASTASAATSIFKADIITSFPTTTHGAITISTNLYVTGGISVGEMTPGQKLSIWGEVVSTGPGSGFVFPDGSKQTKAAGITMWDLIGGNLFSVNPGNVGISTGVPQSKFHIYDDTTENILMVTAGPSNVFGVTGEGNVWFTGTISGNGQNLTNIQATDSSKVLKTGDTMTGPLTLSGSSLTVTGSAFSVDGNVLFVQNQKVAIGTNNLTHKFNVNGGILAISSITTQNDFYGTALYVTSASFTEGIIASSGTFTSSGPLQYSIETTSGIKVNSGGIQVNSGIINAPFFVGDGSRLTNVSGTDANRVLRTGDTMTGQLTVSGSSITIVNNQGSDSFSFAVTTAPDRGIYHLLVSTRGNVGIGISNPTAPLHVFNRILVTTTQNIQSAYMSIQSNTGYSYIHWSDNSVGNKGVLGYLTSPGQEYDLIYRVKASNLGDGTEVLRIKESGFMGIGTSNPTHKLTVAGGLLVTSSITASGGFVGNFSTLSVTGNAFSVGTSTFVVTSGRVGVGITNPGAKMEIRETGTETYTLIVGTNIYSPNPEVTIYDLAVTTKGSVIIGIPEIGRDDSAQLHVVENLRIGANYYPTGNNAFLHIGPYGGPGWIGWSEQGIPRGALGFEGGNKDLIYRANTNQITSGEEVLRITSSNNVGIGNITVPNARLHVSSSSPLATNNILLVSSGTAAGQELFVVKGNGNVGIGTTDPNTKLQVAGGDVYTSTAGNGFIVKSPNGQTCRRIGIDNNGNLSLTSIPCP